MSDEELAAPAVVVSPHFDDEVLGCGGTIVRKLAAGAPITVVYLTDGSRSHDGLIAPGELAAMRQAEGRAAAAVLGVQSGDVEIVGLPETELARAGVRADAVEAVGHVVSERNPSQVFVTCVWESSDHCVANEVVRQVLSRGPQPLPHLYEFPIWTWNRWPWIALRDDEHGAARALARAGAGGWRLLRNVNRKVDVASVLDTKRAALAAYRSQVERVRSDAPWPVLGDVAKGEWLECFFQPYEVFLVDRR